MPLSIQILNSFEIKFKIKSKSTFNSELKDFFKKIIVQKLFDLQNVMNALQSFYNNHNHF